MTTFFVDFDNGNDNYAGSSFGLLASGTDGRITTSTFSAATANFPNDGSLINQYLSIYNGLIYAVYRITAWVSATSLTITAISGGTALVNQTVDRQYYIGGRWKTIINGATAVRIAPGDTVRVMGSPDPTSLGVNGTWTSSALPVQKSVTGATNTTPITVTVANHGFTTGDTVTIMSAAGNTNANGTWEITNTGTNTFTLDGSAGNGTYTSGGLVRLRNNTRVKLASPLTQNIASTGPGRAAWTTADLTNVTTTLPSTTTKEHRDCDSISVAAGFTTGLAAYWPTGTLNLSGYQQVSFWVQLNSGAPTTLGQVDLRLCSDTSGTTAINTINIPIIPVIGRWMPVTVDLGTNLGNSIQSIALYINTDLGAQQFLFSNIIACKASNSPDSLTLTSLIGKNTVGETFWGIQSINGTRVMLDSETNTSPETSAGVWRGYYGVSETVTVWKRETIKLGPFSTTSATLMQIADSGTDGSQITFSGGWDRTNMSTQTSETWVDGVNGNGYGISINNQGFLSIDKFALVRFNRGIASGGLAYFGCNMSMITANNNAQNGINMTSSGKIECQFLCANGSSPFSGGSAGPQLVSLGKVLSNCSAMATVSTGPNSTLTGEFYNNYGAFNFGSSLSGVKIRNTKTFDNAGGIVLTPTSACSIIYLDNCLIGEGVVINQSGIDTYIYSNNNDQVANNHKIYTSGGQIVSATDQRKTPSGISWKLQPTNSSTRISSNPLTLSLAKVACAANSAVTVKAWMRRNNAGLTMRLVCKGGQIAGVVSDVVSTLSSTNSWEEEVITFTPTADGVVEITAEAWGGTTYSGWVDDMTITQV